MAIPRYEARRRDGAPFGLVVYSRPDLAWWHAHPPWRRWAWCREVVSCESPGCDVAWLAPRAALPALTRTAEARRDCASTRWVSARRSFAHCGACASPERLLSYTARAAAISPLCRRLDRRLQPGDRVNVLRSAAGACDAATAPVLASGNSTVWAGIYLNKRELKGLPARTVMALRARALAGEQEPPSEAALLRARARCRRLLLPFCAACQRPTLGEGLVGPGSGAPPPEHERSEVGEGGAWRSCLCPHALGP